MSKKKIPKYRNLGAVVTILYTVGFLCALASIVIIILVPWFAWRGEYDPDNPWIITWMILWMALAGSGLLVTALGSGLAAFRDLAINAWHIRTELEHQRRAEDEP